MRHQDASADPGRTPFALWRTDPAAFVEYQARQSPRAERQLRSARFWASFVVTPGGETLFADLYAASFLGGRHGRLPDGASLRRDRPGRRLRPL